MVNDTIVKKYVIPAKAGIQNKKTAIVCGFFMYLSFISISSTQADSV